MNWRPILFTSLLLASKFWEDRYFWNIDILDKMKVFSIEATNKYENIMTVLLDFNFYVEPETVEQYFKWLVLYQQYVQSQTESLDF
jgi:hypothetical protein